MSKPKTLADKVRANLPPPNAGPLRWYQRVPPEHLAELEGIRTAYRRGDYQGSKKGIASAIAATLQAEGLATVKYQGVLQWLESDQ